MVWGAPGEVLLRGGHEAGPHKGAGIRAGSGRIASRRSSSRWMLKRSADVATHSPDLIGDPAPSIYFPRNSLSEVKASSPSRPAPSPGLHDGCRQVLTRPSRGCLCARKHTGISASFLYEQ